MKKYYQRLTKEQKKDINIKYEKEYGNSDLQVRLNRLKVYAGIGYLFGIILLIYTFKFDEPKIGNIIIAITLFVVSTVYLVGRYIIKLNVLNKIALKNKDKTKK